MRQIPNPKLDSNLIPMCIHNANNSRIYLTSDLKKFYPDTPEPFPKIEIPPGKVMRVEHMYWKIHTLDGMPAKTHILTMNEALECFPKSMWMRPDSKAGEKFSRKVLKQ